MYRILNVVDNNDTSVALQPKSDLGHLFWGLYHVDHMQLDTLSPYKSSVRVIISSRCRGSYKQKWTNIHAVSGIFFLEHPFSSAALRTYQHNAVTKTVNIVPVLIASVRQVILITPPHHSTCRFTSSLVHYSHGTPTTHCPTPAFCSAQKICSERLRAMNGSVTPQCSASSCEAANAPSLRPSPLLTSVGSLQRMWTLSVYSLYAIMPLRYLHWSAAATTPCLRQPALPTSTSVLPLPGVVFSWLTGSHRISR